jgi:mitochondrial distribution and morphology protein 10
MLDFMDYIQRAFFAASKWNVDDSYSSLNSTAEGTFNYRINDSYALI